VERSPLWREKERKERGTRGLVLPLWKKSLPPGQEKRGEGGETVRLEISGKRKERLESE